MIVAPGQLYFKLTDFNRRITTALHNTRPIFQVPPGKTCLKEQTAQWAIILDQSDYPDISSVYSRLDKSLYTWFRVNPADLGTTRESNYYLANNFYVSLVHPTARIELDGRSITVDGRDESVLPIQDRYYLGGLSGLFEQPAKPLAYSLPVRIGTAIITRVFYVKGKDLGPGPAIAWMVNRSVELDEMEQLIRLPEPPIVVGKFTPR